MFFGIIVAIVMFTALVSNLSGIDMVFYVGIGIAGLLGFVHELSLGRGKG